MKRTLITLFLLIAIGPFISFSQSTQNIRGKVIDEVIKLPLPGASVIIAANPPNRLI